MDRDSKRMTQMLMTEVQRQRFSYDYEGHVGRLYMAAGTCCDMAACIKFFEGFDPDVTYISTAAGNKQDTRYRKIDGDWRAFPPAARGEGAP